jgi:hypothetical protein
LKKPPDLKRQAKRSKFVNKPTNTTLMQALKRAVL